MDLLEEGLESITVAELLTEKIQGSGKTEEEIAAAIGYDNPSAIKAFQQGTIKVPIKVVAPLAGVLGIDPAHLLRVVMCQYMPGTWNALAGILGGDGLTEAEREMLSCYRRVTDNTNPPAVMIGGIVALLVPRNLK